MIVQYDPLFHHTGRYSTAMIVRQCQVIVAWAEQVNTEIYPDMFDLINGHYQGGVYESKGGTVCENGIYNYPEDPALYPLCKITMSDEIYFFYEYDFLAIRDKETNETRMFRVD